MYAHPIETFNQRGKLRRRQTHHAIFDPGPHELALQPLCEQAQPAAVPEDQLHSVSTTRSEAVNHTGEWVESQLLLHQRGKAHCTFAEVDRLRRHQHPHGSRRYQHSAAHADTRLTARNTASIVRVSASLCTHTLMAPMAISMAA